MRYPPAPRLRLPCRLDDPERHDWGVVSPWYHVARAVGYVEVWQADRVEESLGNLGWNLAQAGALQLARRSVAYQWLPGMGCAFPGFETQEGPVTLPGPAHDVYLDLVAQELKR